MPIWVIREQYGTWKAECKHIEPTIGSGKLLTEAITSDEAITADGSQPSEDTPVNDDAPDNVGDMPSDENCVDKKVIQWKHGLNQIG